MKKTMKLVLLVCLALLACALMFTACDNGNEEQTPNNTTDGATDGTTEPEIEAHVHSFGEWTTVKEPTCTEDGLEQRFCAECNYTESKPINAKGHTKEILAKEDATCVSYGTKEGFRCTTCSYYERPIDYDLIPTGNHDFTYDRNGANQLASCSKCGADTFDYDRYEIKWKDVYQSKDVAWREVWNGATLLIPTRYDFITYIMPDMFKSCEYALGAIVMLDNITYIGSSAFEDCGLTYVEFTTSVTKIESRAFANCANLLCIRYNGTIEQWNAIEKGTDWDTGTGYYTVYCTDGTITK